MNFKNFLAEVFYVAGFILLSAGTSLPFVITFIYNMVSKNEISDNTFNSFLLNFSVVLVCCLTGLFIGRIILRFDILQTNQKPFYLTLKLYFLMPLLILASNIIIISFLVQILYFLYIQIAPVIIFLGNFFIVKLIRLIFQVDVKKPL